MKTIYLDAISCHSKQLRSALRIIYNFLVLQRASNVTNFKLTLDKTLEMQYPEIVDNQLALLIQQQTDVILSQIDDRGADEFVLIFKVYNETAEDRNFLSQLMKPKTKVTTFEEYHLPVTLVKEPRPIAALTTALKEKINRILQHVQNDQTSINIIHTLKYSLTLEK